MIDWLGQLGASLAKVLLGVGLLWGSVALSLKIIGKRGATWSENRSCITTLLLSAVIFAALAIVFGPAYQALQNAACRGAEDYQACIEGE